MTELLYGEVEDDLRASVRDMLAQRSPAAHVLAHCEADEPHDAAVWQVLAAEMGLAGLLVPEARGGAGAGPREAAVVMEELGRAVAPVPFLGSAVVATTTLAALGDRAQTAELLTRLAGGGVTAVLAVPFATSPAAVAAAATVRVDGAALSGQVRGVADAQAADTLLVPTAAGLFAVAAGDAGVAREPVVSLDLTRPLCDLTMEGAAGQLLAGPAEAGAAVRAGLLAGAGMLASEQLGIAEWCLETTTAYVKSRYQFGRPVGSFQALKHRLADVWVDITQARAAARYAAACLADAGAGDSADADETAVAVSLAQVHCSAVAVHAAEECVQLHGGIGFTWEHPAHLYLKRAKSDAVGFGSPDRHRGAIAGLADLPPA